MNQELKKSIIQVKKYSEELFERINGEKKIEVSFCGRVQVFNEVVKKFDSIIPTNIYAEYKEFFGQFSNFCQLCGAYDFLVDNIETFEDSLEVFIDCLEQISIQLEQHMYGCLCCGRKEGFSGKQGICNYCGASCIEQIIISFLKKVELPYSKKGTSVLQITTLPAVERWIMENCPSVIYHSVNIYMKDMVQDIKLHERMMNAEVLYDFLICSDILEFTEAEQKLVEQLKKILKPDGVGVFLLPLSMEGKENFLQWVRANNLSIQILDQKILSENILPNDFELCLMSKAENDIEELLRVLQEKTDLDQTEQPLVSVIMSCYNHEKYVGAAIESVINQTYKNIEFIIGDDASTDGTASVMKKYSLYYAKEYYVEKNMGGLGDFLLEKASGKYVARMNSDDVWELDKIEKQVKFLERNPEYAVCFSWCNYTDENLNEIYNNIFIQANRSQYQWLHFFFHHGNCLCHPSVLILRDVYLEIIYKVGKAYRQLPDYAMWIEMIQKYNMYVMQESLVKMRRHNSGKVKNVSASTEENRRRHKNEEMYLWYSNMKNMDDNFFTKAFYKELIHKDAESVEEIACEKFFLLLNTASDYMRFVAMLLFFEYGSNDKIMQCFGNKYNYFRQDFFGISATVGMPMMKSVIDELVQRNEKLQQMVEMDRIYI